MTRDEAVELFQREVVPEFVTEMEEAVTEGERDLAALEAGDVAISRLRHGVATLDDARALSDVAREFVAYVKAWRAPREAAPDPEGGDKP